MTLLLDTHTFLWFCQGDSQLSKHAESLLRDPGHRKLVSVASCWEIAIKAGLKKLVLGEPSQTYVRNALARTGFELFPIALEHVTAVENLPMHHKDPFDRLLIAQSIVEHLPVVGGDVVFDAYHITRHWLTSYRCAAWRPSGDCHIMDGGFSLRFRTPIPALPCTSSRCLPSVSRACRCSAGWRRRRRRC